MVKFIRKFLSLMSVVLITIAFCAPAFADISDSIMGDVGDFGSLATEHNREALVNNMKNDMTEFQSEYEREYIDTGVPVEAKLGISFMQALSSVAHVLNDSLVRFVIIFLIAAFAFWVMFEVYRLISDSKTKVRPTVEDIAKKGITFGIWIILLGFGLTELFGMIMGPIVAFGSYISNIILDTVAQYGGFVLSDTCAAIKDYAVIHMKDTSVIDPEFAADIICVPTRMSGFYYGAIKFGWKIMISSLGVSTFSFISGLIFVGLFTYAAFKFAFVAFGVIADLFLVVILLPFTAVAETLNKTKYEGIAGKIYNGLLGLFNTESFSLSAQVKKFIDASVYFIALSIAVAIGGALLANGLQIDSQTHIIKIINGDRITMMLIGALVAYIAVHVDDIAKTLGGGIEYTLGTELSNDVTNLYKGAKKRLEEFIKNVKK